MTDIEQALVETVAKAIERALAELEAVGNQLAHDIDAEGPSGVDLLPIHGVIKNLAALRAKEARENALYAPQFSGSIPLEAMRLEDVRHLQDKRSDFHPNTRIIAMHPFDKAEGKYTGEVIRGKGLAELLEGQ